MYEVMICFSCRAPVSELYEAFCKLRDEKEKKVSEEYAGISPDFRAMLVNAEEGLADIFDKLKVKRSCCRTRLKCGAQFDDYLYGVYSKQ